MTEPLGREIRKKLVIDVSWQPSLSAIEGRPQLVRLANAILDLARGPIAPRYPNSQVRPADPGRSIDRRELMLKLNLAESTVQRQMTALSEAMPGVFYRRYRATSIEIRWPDLVAHMQAQRDGRVARQQWCDSQGRSVGPNININVSARDWVQANELHTYVITVNIHSVESQESAAVICDWLEAELQKFNKLTVQPELQEEEKTA